MNDKRISTAKQINRDTTDNAIANQDAPDPLLRYGFTLLILALLFVAAIYYGLINP